MSSSDSRSRWAWGALGVTFLAVMIAQWMALPPRPKPATAPETEFSAQRALAHIRVMAQEPHPAGSEANDRVCEYIQQTLRDFGLEPVLVERFKRVSSHRINWQRCVLARIPGTAPTKAFAMDAHFDSVPYGPGATDDLSGIGAMLETARALKAGPPLKNDIIFVFADEEEFNMGGARAFREHPWFEDVGVMLGLETRGTSGPALMFETSQNNGFVVREMAKAGISPRANSMMFDVYDRLPFGSDFNQYKRHVAGLNVAYVDRFGDYHTKLDNPENANPASVQHHGAYTLGLARHFGNIPLNDCYAPNAVYYNTLGGHMVVYPESWSMALTVLATVFVVAVFVLGFWRRRLRPLRMLLALAGILGALAVAAAVIGAASAFLFFTFRERALYQNTLYSFSFLLGGLAALFAAIGLLRRWVRPQEFLGVGVLVVTAMLLGLQFSLTGGTGVAMVVVLSGAAYLLLLCALPGEPEEGGGPVAIGAGVLLALPAVMLLAPTLIMFSYTLTSMVAFALVPGAALLLLLVSPPMALVAGRARWAVPATLVLLGVVLYAVAFAGTRPSPRTPRLNCLSYGMDFDAGQGYWLSADRDLDGWTRQFFNEDTPRVPLDEFLPGRSNYKFLKAPAPSAPFPKPVFDVREDKIVNGRRVLRIFLDSPRDAQRTYLTVTSAAEVFGAEVLGHRLAGKRRHWNASFDILPREGTELVLEVEQSIPLKINVREMSYGVPRFSGYEPRPEWMATEPNRTLDHRRPLRSEHTFSTCTFDLGPRPAG